MYYNLRGIVFPLPILWCSYTRISTTEIYIKVGVMYIRNTFNVPTRIIVSRNVSSTKVAFRQYSCTGE